VAGIGSATETYSTADIDNVMRWVGVDFRMIAESSGAISLREAADYQADIDFLAKAECLTFVDVTLFSGADEVRAVRYTVHTSASGLAHSRPGGVLWPRVSYPRLRVVLGETARWNELKASGQLYGKLRIPWDTSYDDVSHQTLIQSGGRNYVSSAFGTVRQDYSK